MWPKPETIQWFTACSVLVILFVVMVGSCLWVTSGCSIALSDKGAVYAEFGQRFELGHETSKTEADSVSTVDLKPLVEYLIELGWAGPDATTNGGP